MARERHVFPTSEVPHKWAHQSQGEARNPQGNLYFKGATIYSYRDSWPLARIYNKGRRGNAPLQGANVLLNATQRAMAADAGILVLTNSEKYGSTTAGHQHAVNHAASHLPQIAVPEVLTDGAWRGKPHDRNLRHLTDLAASLLATAKRALMLSNIEWRRNAARAAIDNANAYMKFFGIRRKAFVFPQLEWTAAAERVERIQNPDPIRDARKIKQREQRKAAQRRALQQSFDNYVAQVATYNAAVIEARKTAPDAAQYWRENGRWPASVEVDYSLRPRAQVPGKSAYSYGRHSATRALEAAGFELPAIEETDGRPADVLLRVDGEQIITSMGARVPLAAAPMVWLLVNREKEKGGRDLRGGLSRIKIGDYPIDSIGADGTLRAGCHVIKYDELDRMARELGLLEGAQS